MNGKKGITWEEIGNLIQLIYSFAPKSSLLKQDMKGLQLVN